MDGNLVSSVLNRWPHNTSSEKVSTHFLCSIEAIFVVMIMASEYVSWNISEFLVERDFFCLVLFCRYKSMAE